MWPPLCFLGLPDIPVRMAMSGILRSEQGANAVDYLVKKNYRVEMLHVYKDISYYF